MGLAETSPRSAARSAWRWWTGELRAMLPEGFRTLTARFRRDLEAEVAGERLALRLRRGRRVRELGDIELPRDDPAGTGPALRELLRRRRGSYDRVVLRVPGERALRRRSRLPLAARDSLDEALGYDMDRQTPFAEDEVYYGAREVAVDRAAGTIEAELAVVRRREVDPALAALHEAGLRVDRLETAAVGGVNLLPPEQRPAGGVLRHRAAGALVLAAAGLAAALVYLPLHQLQSELATVERRVEAARGAANRVETLRQRLAALNEREARLFTRKTQEPLALALLQEITGVMPDGTFAIDLSLQGEEFTITGYSDKASALISRLESAPHLTDARFRSPVTQDQRVGGERYNVAARIARDGGDGEGAETPAKGDGS